MYKSYLSDEWGIFAQYTRKQAGFYRDFPRKLRRDLEIKAHKAGVKQIPVNLVRRPRAGWRAIPNATPASVRWEYIDAPAISELLSEAGK